AFINKVCGLQPLFGLSPRPLCHPLRFWSILIRTLKRFLIKVYSISLAASEQLAIILSFGWIVTSKNEWTEIPETPSKAEPPKYQCDRAGPKIFVPLPDAEIGGCARNDSLIAPAIN
ncbi:hypothetical protein QUB56_27665, partial [Microcoleus sp. AR_TQ3_B6]